MTVHVNGTCSRERHDVNDIFSIFIIFTLCPSNSYTEIGQGEIKLLTKSHLTSLHSHLYSLHYKGIMRL
jgi:hypothetical protein